jgi:hypothetical protein
MNYQGRGCLIRLYDNHQHKLSLLSLILTCVRSHTRLAVALTYISRMSTNSMAFLRLISATVGSRQFRHLLPARVTSFIHTVILYDQ